MSLAGNTSLLASRIAAEFKAVRAEIAASGGGGGVAGTKISALPSAGPLDGTELIPVVQRGVTESIAASALQPWRESPALTAAYTNSTTTGTDVFAGFAPEAGTNYVIDVLLLASSAAITTGIQTAIAGPASGITRAGLKFMSAATTTTDKIDHIAALNSFQIATAGLTTPSLISIQGIISVGVPNAGNIRVQARSEVAGSAITIFPGSTMRWRVV